MILLRFPAIIRPSFKLIIAAPVSNAVLRSLANAAGYGGTDAYIYNNSGIDLFSTGSASPAVTPGSWPLGIYLYFENNGTVSGAGGAGGNGDSYGGGGTAGGAGGTALDASGISGFTFAVNNLGTYRGGGGGGGGGAANGAGSCCATITAAGGGAGGGQGHNGGSGGGGGNSNSSSPCVFPVTNGTAGSSGTTGAPGSGGPGGTSALVNGGTGGNGGGWGTAGATAGFLGGAAGKSVNGYANITWINVGTLTGPTA